MSASPRIASSKPCSRKSLRGEVRFDLGSRALYAADASNYRQLPVGVVFPRDAADVEAALAACRATGAAVLPRGAGTSLAGQCVNVAVVFDYSRYMNALASIDPAAKLARVEPGIVLDRLRDAAEVHHLTYAPDPATHSRCTLGGMIGNNSCGVHGLLGGKVVDNVESLDIVLYDGTRLTVGATPPEQLDALDPRRWPRGPNLRRPRAHPRPLRRPGPRKISRAFRAASPATTSTSCCPKTTSTWPARWSAPRAPAPTSSPPRSTSPPARPYRVLTVLGFNDPFLAADAVPLALEHKPIGLEGFDYLLVDFMRRKGLALRELDQLPPGVGFLLVEMGAWSREEAQAKAESIARASQSWPSPPVAHICTPEEAKSVWHVRESALGAMVFVPGEPDRWEGWEDAAVPPAQLGNYLRAITTLMASTATAARSTATTARAACTPASTSTSAPPKGVRRFREFIDRAADVVLSFGGSLSGEHGDGQARAALLPKMFGPELIEAFREFKMLWDPDNRMNPGKLSDAVRVYDPTENLRHHHASAPKRQNPRRQSGRETHFAFAKDNGSLERATERCVGVGSCRNTQGGVMCPSYRATGEEQHSTRGRAHLLWEMLAGALQQRRLPEPRRPRSARPLPQLQGLQIRVPGAGGHGRLQIRVPRAALQGPPAPAPSLHLRLCRPPCPLRLARAVAHQRHAHRPAHQPAHQAHRRRSARAPTCRASPRRAIQKRVHRAQSTGCPRSRF